MKQFKFKNNREIDLQHVEINLKSIKLVSITQNFAEDIFREFTSEITHFMVPKPAEEISETHDFISSSIEGMKHKNDLVLAINSSQNEFLGCVGLHGRGKCHTPELGIWIKKSAHGNGYGKAAVSSVFNWATENLEFEYAIYPVDKSNLPSRRIPESLGGKIIEKAVVKKLSGGVLDEVIYQVKA